MPRRRTPPVDPPESFTVNKRLVWIVGTVVGAGYALLKGGWIAFDIYQRFVNLERIVNSNFVLPGK